MQHAVSRARDVIARCQLLAKCTTEPGCTTRPFLSEPMHEVQTHLASWMTEAGMTVSIDAAGNLRGSYTASRPSAPRLFIGSHLDTVPRAGAYDGVLGVVLGVALVGLLNGHHLNFNVEVIGFSDEEGFRFGVPFIGSRALIGDIDDRLLEKRDSDGVRVADAIRGFGLDPARISDARAGSDAMGYFEFHIEQGPILDDLGLRLAVVEAIAGQSRLTLVFSGQANHAGTTPMRLRRDALAGAAEWIGFVEKEAHSTTGLAATVGQLQVEPGATNVIPGVVRATLDIRHADDSERKAAVQRAVRSAEAIAAGRGLSVSWDQHLDQAAVAMDSSLTRALERAVVRASYPVHRMISGAGHDAMIVARRMPATMLFVRSPAGISHHYSESVLEEDVAAALTAGLCFLEEIEAHYA